jgi:hypothetical protein
MSDYNDKVMVCLISEIEFQYIKHLRRVYQYAYNPEVLEVYQGRLEKMVGLHGSITSFLKGAASCGSIMCSCNYALNLQLEESTKKAPNKVRSGSRM